MEIQINNMNIAVCYHGLARTYKDCLPNHFETFYKKYNIKDIFFHLWWNKDDAGQIERGAPWSETDFQNSKITIDSNLETNLINLLHPKDYLLEPSIDPIYKKEDKILSWPYNFEEFTEEQIQQFCYYPNFCSMLSVKRVYDLIHRYSNKNNITYDFIVLARMDMLWESLDIWPSLEKNNIYCYWDTLWIFSMENFRKYAERIFYLPWLVTECIKNNGGTKKEKCFFSHEQLQEIYFKNVLNIDINSLVKIHAQKLLHRGDFIKN